MEIIIIVTISFLASAVSAVTSFGTSTIMIPVLSLFYSFNPVLLFTGIIHGSGNVGKIFWFRKGVRWKLILLFGIPGILFSYLGTLILPNIPAEIVLRILGVFILIYIVYILKNPKWKLPEKNSTAIAGGALTGLSAAIFGVQGAIRALFLSAFNLPKEVFIATAGAIAIVIDVTRVIGYINNNFSLNQTLVFALVLSVPATFLGTFIGKKLISKIPQKKFRYIIAAALIIISAKYIVFG